MKGHSQEEYDAVWEFYKWLACPDVSVQWHKDTGYFPTSVTAVRELMDQGWFSEQPNFLHSLHANPDRRSSRGIARRYWEFSRNPAICDHSHRESHQRPDVAARGAG